MKEYHERLKQDPEKYQKYLVKARQRRNINYTPDPVSLLTTEEITERRAKTREYLKGQRSKKKLEAEEHVQTEIKVSSKPVAQRMKEYRERLKQDPEKYQKYLVKARQRKNLNYTPVSLLTTEEITKRRSKTREYLKRHRNKKKLEADVNVHTESRISVSDTSCYVRNAHEEPGPLQINFPFQTKRSSPTKCVSQKLARKNRENKTKLKIESDGVPVQSETFATVIIKQESTEEIVCEMNVPTECSYSDSSDNITTSLNTSTPL